MNNILAITREMLCAAENEDWDQLSHLEGIRSLKLLKFSADTGAADYPERVLIETIESVLDLDRQIIHLCYAESSSCKEQVRDFKKGRKAIANYHQFSS